MSITRPIGRAVPVAQTTRARLFQVVGQVRQGSESVSNVGTEHRYRGQQRRRGGGLGGGDHEGRH